MRELPGNPTGWQLSYGLIKKCDNTINPEYSVDINKKYILGTYTPVGMPTLSAYRGDLRHQNREKRNQPKCYRDLPYISLSLLAR